MKRKITGICLMVVMILSLWYGMSLPVESAAAFSETEQAVDLNQSMEGLENGADSEEDETGDTEDTEDTAEDEADGENDTDEIIIDAEECEENLTEDIPDEDAVAEFPDISIETADNDNGAEEVFSAEGDEADEFDAADPEAMVARATSSVPVKWVAADYQMRSEYAFTYAFRANTSSLVSISRYNGTLNTKMHNWYGDERGFTEEYCKTFLGCVIDDQDYADPITAIYSNVGEYNGKVVDLKVTAVKWGPVNKNHIGNDGRNIIPCILFYKNRIAFNTIGVGTVRFRFEFLDHATQNKISPKGHVTLKDLDAGQGIRVYDGWGVNRIYLCKGYDYLKKTTAMIANGAVYNELSSPEGEDIDTDDVKAWCQLDFDGYFMLNWNSQESWNNETYPQNAFFLTTGKTVGTYEPNPKPEKRVGNDGAAYNSMTKHEFTRTDPPYGIKEGKKYDYVIAQRLMPGSYSSFVLKDTLDSCLKFRRGSVTTSAGKDVTSRFRIENTKNTITFTANTSYLKSEEAFNDVTYYFRIKVTAGSNTVISSHNHISQNGSAYSIENKASRTIVSDKIKDTQQTNSSWVKGEIPREIPDGQIVITKRIREQDIIWAHGNPVFRFCVTGTDGKGISHAYEDFVEFRKGEYPTDRGYAVLSCTFSTIPLGRYTVSEKKTLRYVFESITAQTANVSLNDRTGTVTLDKNNKKAAVTFTNKKTKYDRYSHTDVIRNKISIRH